MGHVRAVLFDLGGTLWHSPALPPVQVLLQMTADRVGQFLAARGTAVRDPLGLGDDLRAAILLADAAASRGNWVSPDFAVVCGGVARRWGLALDDEGCDGLLTWAVDE
jgi:FMN phosphatase YigB (HAD superfamily)